MVYILSALSRMTAPVSYEHSTIGVRAERGMCDISRLLAVCRAAKKTRCCCLC